MIFSGAWAWVCGFDTDKLGDSVRGCSLTSTCSLPGPVPGSLSTQS